MKLLIFVTALGLCSLGDRMPFAVGGSLVNTHADTAVADMADSFFQIAVLPDVQYYTSLKNGGSLDMFQWQIDWILQNRVKEKIAYVVQLGDISDHGNKKPEEWQRAREVMYQLEKPVAGLPDGIPYGMAVGNHDETPNGNPNETGSYEYNFGRKHFAGRAYYGGSYNDMNSNDNHYDLFSADGDNYIVLYLAYNEPDNEYYDAALEQQVYGWGAKVLQQYADRKAIIVSHSILAKANSSNSDIMPGEGTNEEPGRFTRQGKAIYNYFKKLPNVFLMLCGHRSGEAYREETYEGRTIKIFLTDYQSRRSAPYAEADRNGGNGMMRLMKFNKTAQTLSVTTFAPRKNEVIKEEDGDSEFTVPLYGAASH